MAVHPLRPATYHRLGGPLPHQQANRTQGSPAAFLFIRLDMSPPDFTRSYQSFPSVIPDCRASPLRVTHPSALARLCKHSFAKDLHVLSILSAFILSQDQTLHSTISFHLYFLSHIIDAFPSFFLPLFYMSSIVLSTTPAVDKNYSIKYYPLLSITFFNFFYK